MKTWKKLQRILTLVSCMGLALPVSAANPPEPGNTKAGIAVPSNAFAQDIAMQRGGTLQGKIASSSGAPLADASVRIQQNEVIVGECKTDANGNFVYGGLRGGVYQVMTAGAASQLRLWAAQTAPPHANQAALLVTDSQVVRGQCCDTDSCTESCDSDVTYSYDDGCGDGCTGCGCDDGYGYSTGCHCGGRGCCGGYGTGGGNWKPWLIAAGAAAAIAIPLSLDDDDAS